MIIQTSDKTKTTNHRDEIFLLRGVPLYSLAPASGDQWDIISLLMQALLPQSNAYHGRTIFNINFLTDLLSIIYLKNWGRLH